MTASSRLAPLGRHDVPELEETFSNFERLTGFVANAFLIMARRPHLVMARFAIWRSLFDYTTLNTQMFDLVGMMTSIVIQSEYSQAHRKESAARRGIDYEKFLAIAEFESSPHFSDAERAALRLARDASSIPNAVTDEHFAELRKFFTEAEIVDLVGSICDQGWMNRWNDTMGTQLEQKK